MRRLVVLLAALSLIIAVVPAAAAPKKAAAPNADPASPAERPVVEDLAGLSDLRLDQPIAATGVRARIDEQLLGADGLVEVSILLTEPAVANKGQARKIEVQQRKLEREIDKANGRSLGATQTVLNAVFAEIPADEVAAIASLPEVASVKRVANYETMRDEERDLDETVPYIGGTAAQDLGFTGEGITVAVLDSGVDYTHAALGGPGNLKAYEAAYGKKPQHEKNKKINDVYKSESLFPTDKVVGGYDFVGEDWPFGDLAPDPDPIDFEGHGTHVADIIAGEKGVAPDADILAVKVCSAVSPSCSGVALIQGMEYAVEQGVDVINMSLGSLYGQAFDDDLSQAVENASAMGVLTVASAGNSADKPYVTGSPAAAPSALSVAQTQTPSASLQLIGVLDAVAPAVFQSWSLAPTEPVAGTLQYADGAGGNLQGCDPFADGSLTGLVVLVDRGACSFTQKIANVARAGGVVGIIGLVAPGAPFDGGFDGAACGADNACGAIPGYMISQDDSTAFKALVGETATLDPANTLELVGQLVGSSARGPSMLANLIKPEIGAPGASISAEVGTGTATTPFGGTSGAAPMVAGAAALLLEAEPNLIPAEVKARLINTGETDIDTDPFTGLAPITRIGGGEVRADRAIQSSAAAWEDGALQGALSFSFDDVTATTSYTKTIRVRNYGDDAITYSITPTFRFGNDAGTGAVTPAAPSSITVAGNSDATFDLTLSVDPTLLYPWVMSSGFYGADPDRLTLNEFDGYLLLEAEGDSIDTDYDDIHLPWHILPRAAGDVAATGGIADGVLDNAGAVDSPVEGYVLYAESPDQPEGPQGGQAPVIDLKEVGVQTFVVPTAFCESELLMNFAVTTWERQSHANAPALFEFDLDIDGDGEADYAVYNADLSLAFGSFNLGDGRNAVYAEDLSTGDASVFWFTDHQTNSGLTVLTVCGEQVGLSYSDLLGGPVVVDVVGLAVDIYFTGDVTDAVEFSWAPGYEQYFPVFGNWAAPGTVPAGGSLPATTLDFGGSVTGTELGVLVLHRDGAPEDNESSVIRP